MRSPWRRATPADACAGSCTTVRVRARSPPCSVGVEQVLVPQPNETLRVRLTNADGTTNADESASVNTSEDGDEAEDARYLSEEVSMAQCEGDHTSTKSVLTRALLQAALVGRNATVH